MGFYKILFALIVAGSPALAQSTFVTTWRSSPWDSGGLHPNSVVWSMVQSELDLDNDGRKEFLLTTSWSGTYYNMVYLYEFAADNSPQIVWSYSFYGYSSDYSAVAIGDLNQNGRKEILCLVDPESAGYHGFYVFEWDGTDNGFPALPTATWNLNLPGGFAEGTAIITSDLDGDGRDEVAVSIVDSWSPAKSRVMIFSLAQGSTFASPVWQVELVDSTTFAVVGYALAATDLDRDGRRELVASGWEALHIAIYENTGSANSYTRAANILNISSDVDLSNMGIIEANLDNNSTNELYVLTGGGKLLVGTNNGNVGQMTASNFSLLHQYNSTRGMVGLTKADIDLNGQPEFYAAGSYHEAVFQWQYNGGAVINPSSYAQRVVFQDDTTDSQTPGSDQGYVRPTKVIAGDIDRDGRPDIIIASASFAGDKPVLMMIEQATTSVDEGALSPTRMPLVRNFPNPFNPSTTIQFSLPRQQYATLKVFDVLGREVATLVNGELNAGVHSVVFSTGGRFSSGVYYCRLQAEGVLQTRTMILMR